MELEILWDLWVSCLFDIEQIYINKGTEGSTEQKMTLPVFVHQQTHVVHNFD